MHINLVSPSENFWRSFVVLESATDSLLTSFASAGKNGAGCLDELHRRLDPVFLIIFGHDGQKNLAG